MNSASGAFIRLSVRSFIRSFGRGVRVRGTKDAFFRGNEIGWSAVLWCAQLRCRYPPVREAHARVHTRRWAFTTHASAINAPRIAHERRGRAPNEIGRKRRESDAEQLYTRRERDLAFLFGPARVRRN